VAWYKEWNYETFAEGATYIQLGGHHVGHWQHSSSLLVGRLVGWLVGLGPKILDSGSQPSFNGSPLNLHTRLVWVKAEKLPANFFPISKKLAGENLKFRRTSADPPSIGSA